MSKEIFTKKFSEILLRFIILVRCVSRYALTPKRNSKLTHPTRINVTD